MRPRSAFEGKPGGSGDDAAQAARRRQQVDLPQVRGCRCRAGRVCCLDLFRAGCPQVGRWRSRCYFRAGRVCQGLFAAGCHPQAELPHLGGCRCRCRCRCRAWRASRRDLFPARCPQVAIVVAAVGVAAAGILLLWRVVLEPLFLKWAAVVVALGVCAFGILLLWGVWDGRPVAAAFTRVGGATRVETALEASRFWLTPPQCVVETRTDASQIMLGAAQCAMVHDAPLLFHLADPKRQRLVDAKINDWQEAPKGPAERTRIQRATLAAIALEVIHIQNQREATNCLAKRIRPISLGCQHLRYPTR